MPVYYRGKEKDIMKVTTNFVQVKPYQHPFLEEIRSIFQENYFGCKIDLENIRHFPHTGFRSELTCVDVVVTGNDGSTTVVSSIVKTMKPKNRAAPTRLILKCCHTRFLSREVAFYTTLLPQIAKITG